MLRKHGDDLNCWDNAPQAFCCVACRRSVQGKRKVGPLPPSDHLGSLVPPLPMAHGQIRTGSLEKVHHSSGAKG